MPTTRTRPNETREMRLFSKVIELDKEIAHLNNDASVSTDDSLPQFIARRRMPGDGWRTWDEIRYELRDVAGEIVSDGSMRTWARRYGVPENTKADGSDKAIQEYTDALREAGIDL